jgi:protein arginine kinase activator
MKCELCHTAEAEMAVRQAVDGEVRELFVCRDCSRKAGGERAENVLMELLFGAAFAAVRGEASESRCPSCGLTRGEYRRRSRLGCAGCYAHFARELAPVLRDMHKGTRHVGKVPRREHGAIERRRLEAALQAAVAAQRFEEAAALRDRLRTLRESGQTTPAAGGERNDGGAQK